MSPTSPNLFTAPSTLTPHNSTYPFIDPSQVKDTLRGKVTLVTGAGRGIGRSTALAFAAAGANVVCVSRRHKDIDSVAREIESKHNVSAIAITGDVSDPTTGERAVEAAEKPSVPRRRRRVEGLVPGIRRQLSGAVSMIRAVLPGMIRKGSGTIISVTSTSGSQDIPYTTAYSASKAALIKFHQDIDSEIRQEGIVNYTIHPGTVVTDLGTVEGAVNMEVAQKTPGMMQCFAEFQKMAENGQLQTKELSADTMVVLASSERCKILSGRYIDSQYDLEEVLKEAGKEGLGKIGKEKLYWLKMDEL